MSQLEAAQRHLAQALERLEDALALRLAQPPPGTDADYQRAFAESPPNATIWRATSARCAASAIG